MPLQFVFSTIRIPSGRPEGTNKRRAKGRVVFIGWTADRCVGQALVVGRYRERKADLPLADKRLEVLIQESGWLAFHQLRQATQSDEPSLAKVQHGIDQHLAFHLALG